MKEKSSSAKSGERPLCTRKLPKALGNGGGASSHNSKPCKLLSHLCLTVLNAFLKLFPRKTPAGFRGTRGHRVNSRQAVVSRVFVLDLAFPLFLASQSPGLLSRFVPEARAALGFRALGLQAHVWD